METVTDTTKSAFSAFRFAALTIVSLGFALYMQVADHRYLTKMDSMSASDYMAYERHLHSHGIAPHFFSLLVFGVIYLAAVEVVTFGLRRVARLSRP